MHARHGCFVAAHHVLLTLARHVPYPERIATKGVAMQNKTSHQGGDKSSRREGGAFGHEGRRASQGHGERRVFVAKKIGRESGRCRKAAMKDEQHTRGHKKQLRQG